MHAENSRRPAVGNAHPIGLAQGKSQDYHSRGTTESETGHCGDGDGG